MALSLAVVAFAASGSIGPPSVGALPCVVPLGGPDTTTTTGGVIYSFHATDGGLLIPAEGGLFRFDTASREVVPFGTGETGPLSAIHNLTNGDLLIAAERGWFWFDAASRELVPLGTAETGYVLTAHGLPSGGLLIDADRGWFRFDAASHKVVPAGTAETGYVLTAHGLPDGGLLIHANRGWFRFDAASREVVPVATAEMGNVFTTRGLPDGDLLIRTDRGLFRFDTASQVVVPAGTPEPNHVYIENSLSGGDVLIRENYEWFRFDAESHEMVPLGTAETGPVFTAHKLPGGGLLINADRGWFRFDAASPKVVPAGTADTGYVFTAHHLPKGGLLIRADRGWFQFDAASHEVVLEDTVETGDVLTAHDLPDGDLLIRADRGLFQFDAASRKIVPVATAEMGEVSVIHELPDGGFLIGAAKGLFHAPPMALSRAKIIHLAEFREWVPQSDAREVRFSFVHPCAPVAHDIGLNLVVSRRNDHHAEPQVRSIRRADSGQLSSDFVDLAASAVFDTPGEWALEVQLAGTTIGDRQTFTLTGPTLLQRLIAAWQTVLPALFAAYILFFFALLWMSHRSLKALRVLMDPAWGAKALTWPFFLLRHVPAVQCWVLEPWFQEVRRSIADRTPAYLDPPVSDGCGETVLASRLLDQLSARKRVWLQGRTGMGKSMVFDAWERTYFSGPNHRTLATAARKHGFILVMVPVRHYAKFEPPEPGNPESWVVDAVRRRFEEFGVPPQDVGTLRAMLRTGHIAIALDGTNEADRNDAIATFARQYPQVPLIATSQSDPSKDWDIWRLPPDLTDLRAALLRLWLDDEAADILEERLEKNKGVVIASGYDLRLVVDLVYDNPAEAALPVGRIGLYQAVLAQATFGDGTPLDLSRLRQLAAKLLVEGRREFSLDEGQSLGESVADILSSDDVRVIRRVGGSWEFRHDQMRAFLAASFLSKDTPTLGQLIVRIEDEKMLALRRDDQDALWSFLADLLADDDVKSLWDYAQENPGERGLLQGALQRVADRQQITLVRPITGDLVTDRR